MKKLTFVFDFSSYPILWWLKLVYNGHNWPSFSLWIDRFSPCRNIEAYLAPLKSEEGSMENFIRISNSLGCGVLIFDERMRIEHVNAQAVKIFRLPPENLIGQRMAGIERMFVGSPGMNSLLKHCVEKHECLVNQELELRRPEGDRVVISLNAAPLTDAGGKVEGLVLDFIERPRREERLHQFIGAMDEVVFEFDNEGRYLNVWSGNEGLLKMRPEELLGKRVEEIVSKELAETLKSAFQRVQRTGKPETIEYPMEVLNGRRWFLGRIAKVAAPEGGEPTFSFLARDITKRKELEERLQESERKFHGIFDESFQFFGLLTPDGRLMEINKTACEFFGVEESEVLGKPFWETPWWGHSPDRQKELQQVIQDAAQGTCVRFETVHPAPDGKEHFFDVSIKPVFDQNGKVELLIPEGRDVTERKRAEEELRVAHRQFQDIVDFLPDATFVIDRDKKVIAWNRAIEEMTGVHKEEILGKENYAYAIPLCGKRRPVLIDLVDRPLAELKNHYKVAGKQGETKYVEHYLPIVHGGKGAYIWATASQFCDSEGNLIAAIQSIRDITERKQAEEELKGANRELDAFVHTISHDLRTPLTVIFGYAQLVKELYREVLDERGLEMLAEIEKSSGRMENLLVDLLALAKVGKIQRPAEPVNTNLVVQDALASLTGRISGTGVEVNIVETLPALQLPETLLTQIFDNLIGNAVLYAGKNGSPIEIGGERKGARVRLYVRDHGAGIPLGERKHIFDLFYRGSTGKKLHGTGIGLATVQKIARHYGGEAWVEKTPGGGATFWVELAEDKQ